MANYERRPTDPDDVRVFDGGEDDEEEGGSHLAVVIVISLLVLAAFGGVVWLAYNNGVARGHADIPGVVAQNTASEQPAAAPGSGAMPPKQIKIYQQQAGADEDMNQTVVAPVSTQPAEHPLAMRTQPVEEGAAAAAPAKATPKSVEVASAKPPAALAMAPAPAGAFVLQIGAYKSQSEADAAWKTYQSKHAALLSGLGPDVQKADLGDKGVWYRLRVGSFADKAAAAALCDRLKADGGACFPAK